MILNCLQKNCKMSHTSHVESPSLNNLGKSAYVNHPDKKHYSGFGLPPIVIINVLHCMWSNKKHLLLIVVGCESLN